jgi:DHA2 family multidrug resistance protein-like MFS transporter
MRCGRVDTSESKMMVSTDGAAAMATTSTERLEVTVGRGDARRWAALAVLALPCLVVSMDSTVLGLALAAISADLHPSAVELLWVGDAYTFVGAGALLFAGSLGDRFGRRRVLMWGAGAFGACSVLAAFAPSAAVLVAARALLGAAGALLMTSTLALVRMLFDDDRRRRTALGVWTASFAIGGLCGPVVGGLLLAWTWWGGVFLVAVPVMALLACLGPLLLDEARSGGPVPLDPASAALSLGTVVAFVAAVKALAARDPAAVPLSALAVSAVLGLVFVRRQRRLLRTGRRPLVDLDLLATARTAAPLLTNALAFFVLYGSQLLLAQYLQLGLGLSALEAGLWGMPGTVGYLVGAVLSPLAVRRSTPVRVVTAGLVLCAAGFGVIALVGTAGLPVFVVGAVVSSVGLAPVYAVTTDMVGSAAPADRPGTTAAVTETGAELGGALGIALLGSLATAIYQASLPPTAPGEARATLGGAYAAAQALPDPAAAELREAAAEAFATALTVAQVCGALALLGAAVAFPLALRRAAGLARLAERHPDPRDGDREGADEGGVRVADGEVRSARQRGHGPQRRLGENGVDEGPVPAGHEPVDR